MPKKPAEEKEKPQETETVETVEQAAEIAAEPEAVEVMLDDSPCDMPELVPDPPFHGKWNLLVGVNFNDADGNDVRIEAGVIDGTTLPLDFAESLFEAKNLVKA